MSKAAMKLALEALELCNGTETAEGVVVYTDKEITALREALAEQPSQTDWEAVAADQAMTIALLKAEQPAQRTWVGLPKSAFTGMTLQQVIAMQYAEQVLKDENT